MKKILELVVILIIFIFGISVGVLIDREYQKLNPGVNLHQGTTYTEYNKKMILTVFVSEPIKTYKGEIVQVTSTVANRTDKTIYITPKSCKSIFEMNYKYNNECVKSKKVKIEKKSSYTEASILPYEKGQFDDKKLVVKVDELTLVAKEDK